MLYSNTDADLSIIEQNLKEAGKSEFASSDHFSQETEPELILWLLYFEKNTKD